MLGRFLTESERERQRRFPADLPPRDVTSYFTPSEADRRKVDQQRGDHNRLGFALQLCALRYLGFAPDELTTAPAAVVNYLAEQLDVRPDNFDGLSACSAQLERTCKASFGTKVSGDCCPGSFVTSQMRNQCFPSLLV